MSLGQSALLGIGLLLTGLVFVLLVGALLRLIPRLRPAQAFTVPLPAPAGLPSHDHALLLVRPGGRVDYANQATRQWFKLRQEEQPNLEALARRIHPSDDFLSLCAAEGHIRFSLNGRPIEGISYQIPGALPALLVSLYRPERALVPAAEAKGTPGSTLKLLTEFSQAVALQRSSTDCVKAVLEQVERLIPADRLEVKTWDAEEGRLRPYYLSPGPGSERHLETGLPLLPAGYTASLVEKRQPLFVPDTQASAEIPYPADGETGAIRSYIGVPLLAGEELAGTLEAGLFAAETYTTREFEILQLIAGPAAIAIRNAALLEAEQERAAELGGLANLAQATSSIRDPKELFTQLIHSLAPLFDVEVLGFLIYNENRLALEAQVPFVGLQAKFVELYRVPLPNDSPAEKRFLERELLATQNAAEDEAWRELGFQDFARAASMRETILVPLLSGGRSLGYLQVSNHRQPGMAFSSEEIHRLNIVANQVASIIDNVTLVQQTRQRSLRSDALWRIASLASSSATLDEVLRYAVHELARLLQADVAAVFLLDETHGVLSLHKDSLWGVAPETAEPLSRLFVDDPQFRLMVTGSQRPFISDRLLKDKRVLAVYRPLVEGLRVESCIVAPLVVHERGIGELMIGSRNSSFFDNYDLQTVSTAAGQLAIAVESTSLTVQTDESLRRRIDHLTALTRISRELNNTQEIDRILQVVYEESRHLARADGGAILLVDGSAEAGAGSRITAYAGNAPGEELLPIEQEVLASGKPLIIASFEQGEYRPAHEGVQSALIVPITYQERTSGLIHLHAQSPSRFDETAAEIVQSLAVQAAIALDNNQRDQEQRLHSESLRRRAEGIEKSFETQIESLTTSLKRQEQLLSTSQRHLPIFLHKDLEQMITIRNLERRTRRIRAGMELIETINRQVDEQSALLALGHEMLARLEMSISIVAENTAEGARLVQILGNVPHGVNAEALFGQRNPLRHCLQTGETLLVMNLDEDDTWQDTPLLTGLHAKGFICLPILLDNNPVAGVLALSREPLPALTNAERAVFLQIVHQVSNILQNIRLLTETRNRLREVNLLLDFSRKLSGLDSRGIVAALLDNALRVITNAHAGAVLLWDEHESLLVPAVAQNYVNNDRLMEITYQRGEALPGETFEAGQPRRVAEVNFAQDYKLPAEHLLRYREATGGRLPVSSLLVPIQTVEQALGILVLDNFNTSAAFTPEDEALLLSLTQQVALALENVRLLAETRLLAAELEQRVAERTAELAREKLNTETLLRVLGEVSASLDLDRALNRTLALLNEVIGAEQGSILLINAEDNTIHYRAGYGYMMPSVAGGTKPTALKIGEGLAGWVIKNRQAALITDVSQDERWVELPVKSPYQRSVIAAPLIVGEEVIGVIMVFHHTEGIFTPENMNMVQAIGSQVAVAINNAQLYELIRDQAERLGNMLRNQQVEASRQQAILEAVADGVLVTDANNEINFVNSSTERILGLKAETTRGQALDNFVGLFGKETQAWTQTIRAWSEDPTSYQPGDTYAEQLNLENERVVLVHLAPVIWRNEFLGTVSIFRDITHEVEVDRLKSEFVATVSHELRTPMTAIKGYADLLLMGAAGMLNEKQTHFLEIVSSNTERLSILVNDLLDLSRIEAGRVSLSLQPLDLREVAESAMGEVARRSQVEKKEMDLKLDAPPDLPRVYGDLERVHQILSNLLDNAYRYTPEKGHITVHLQKVEGEVQVDVMDNGVGIAPADQGRIFERFFRGENPLVLATAGTGLGLPIVKQLVSMHKGQIWMRSTGIAGEGSTFSFTLPLYQAKE